MPPRATRSVKPRANGAWRTLGRHQIGAIAATAVDFVTMIMCVHGGASPVAGTAVGASLGAVTNFSLGRKWIFPRHTGRVAGQVSRYALVSAASAGWNVLGEHLVHDRAHVQYVLARMLVAVAVSVLWNFPMHRQFVFQARQST